MRRNYISKALRFPQITAEHQDCPVFLISNHKNFMISLIIIFTNILLIMSVNNSTYMYLRVYFKVEVYFRVS